jgi:hypothetical protein
MKLDFEIADDGPVVLFTPLTARAYQWVEAHIAEDRQWFGRALMVERAFAPVLVNGMVGEGMLFGALNEDYKQ